MTSANLAACSTKDQTRSDCRVGRDGMGQGHKADFDVYQSKQIVAFAYLSNLSKSRLWLCAKLMTI